MVRNKLFKYSKARTVAQSVNDYVTECLNIPSDVALMSLQPS